MNYIYKPGKYKSSVESDWQLVRDWLFTQKNNQLPIEYQYLGSCITILPLTGYYQKLIKWSFITPIHEGESRHLWVLFCALTLRKGFTLEVMLKGKPHNSHFLASLDFTQRCKHFWCTHFILPQQSQGLIRVSESSATQWHIRHMSPTKCVWS